MQPAREHQRSHSRPPQNAATWEAKSRQHARYPTGTAPELIEHFEPADPGVSAPRRMTPQVSASCLMPYRHPSGSIISYLMYYRIETCWLYKWLLSHCAINSATVAFKARLGSSTRSTHRYRTQLKPRPAPHSHSIMRSYVARKPRRTHDERRALSLHRRKSLRAHDGALESTGSTPWRSWL